MLFWPSRELGNALLAMGIVPSQKAIQRYHMSSSASARGSLDLPTVRSRLEVPVLVVSAEGWCVPTVPSCVNA